MLQLWQNFAKYGHTAYLLPCSTTHHKDARGPKWGMDGTFGTAITVTRFGDITPLRQKSLAIFRLYLFNIWQNFEPILCKFYLFLGKLSFIEMTKY